MPSAIEVSSDPREAVEVKENCFPVRVVFKVFIEREMNVYEIDQGNLVLQSIRTRSNTKGVVRFVQAVRVDLVNLQNEIFVLVAD